jgi:hypothetical protein
MRQMNQIRLKPIAAMLILAGLALGAARATAQEPAAQAGARRGGGQFAGMQRVNGEVTAVSGATITIKTEDGVTMQVVTTDNTRVMKGRGLPGQGRPAQSGQAQGGFDANPVKVSDVKVGDGVMVAGNLDAPNKTLHAAFVVATDAATVKALKENLGKTYIIGKVTAIDLDDAKMTVERTDKVSQTIAFDETTSFKRGRGMRAGAGGGTGADPAARGADGGESITLADIKVGDNVSGQGVVKAGTFVPAQLTVSTPGQGGPRRGAGATPGTTPPPGAGPGLN